MVQGVLQSLKQRKEWWLGVARNTARSERVLFRSDRTHRRVIWVDRCLVTQEREAWKLYPINFFLFLSFEKGGGKSLLCPQETPKTSKHCKMGFQNASL